MRYLNLDVCAPKFKAIAVSSSRVKILSSQITKVSVAKPVPALQVICPCGEATSAVPTLSLIAAALLFGSVRKQP